MSRPHSPKHCVRCGRRGKVTDSRPVPSLSAHRRHHVCRCGHEWNTYETALHPSLIEQVVEAMNNGGGARHQVSVDTPGRTTIRKP